MHGALLQDALPGAGAAAAQQTGEAACHGQHSAQGAQAAGAAQAPPAGQEPSKKRKRRRRAKVDAAAAEPQVKGELLHEAASDDCAVPKKQNTGAAIKAEAPAAAAPAAVKAETKPPVARASVDGPQRSTWAAADHATWHSACKAVLKAYNEGGAAAAQAAAANSPAAPYEGQQCFLRTGPPAAIAAAAAPAADAAQIQQDAIHQWQAAQLAA
jgi:hypothetical protein